VFKVSSDFVAWRRALSLLAASGACVAYEADNANATSGHPRK
jgi:hypothetical protein